MDEKFNRIMPKNKTGIYASEIRNMLVPNLNESYTMSKISLTNPFNDLGYRKHSAFKVNVKPRQALASVNTKLMEQQRPNTKASYAYEYTIEDDSDKNSNNQDDTENYLSTLVSNKLAFRPSTVLRKHKIFEERPALVSSRTSSSKSISLYRNKNPENIKTICPEVAKSITPALINKKDTKHSKLDSPTSNRQKTLLNFNENVEFSDDGRLNDASDTDLHSPKTKTDISILSNTNNFSRFKTKTDLFKEIYDDLQARPNKNERQVFKRNENETFKEENFELLIKNLNEEQFVNLLKEYRKTKSLNLNSILTKERDEPDGLDSNAKSTKIINLKGEFERSSTIFSNVPTNSTTRFPSVNHIRNNISTASLNSNRLEKDHYNSVPTFKRIPEYFVNYLNKKILVRETGKQFGVVGQKSADISNAQDSARDLDKSTNNDSNQIQAQQQPTTIVQEEQNDNQKYQHLKILNIPTTAN